MLTHVPEHMVQPVTLTLTNLFGLLGGLLVLAYVANRFSRRTRVPDVIVLLGSGIVLGPVLHWIDASRFPQISRGIGTLALILILFAAGLELDLRRSMRQFFSGMVLGILSYALTMAGVAYFCLRLLHMDKLPAMLVAAPLACMSGSIVLPILEQLDLRFDLKTTLVIEASFGDGLGALVVGVLLGMAGGTTPESAGSILRGMFAMFFFRFLLAVVIAVIAGFLWVRLLPHISDKQFWQALTLAAVLMVYSITHALGGSDLVAVMVFGATLTSLLDPQNQLELGFELLQGSHSTQIHSFHSELAFLVRSFFFVLLGSMIQFHGLREQLVSSVGILCVMLIARAIAVTASRVVWRGTSARERELTMTLIPRGLITAVLALEVVAGMPKELAFLPALTFALILFTNVLVLVASIRAVPLAVNTDAQTNADALPRGD